MSEINYTSLTEAARKELYFDYYNGKVKELLVEYYLERGIDIIAVVKKNREEQKGYCLNCGTPLKGGTQKMFCSHNCSATYNNKKRKHSKETKEKISKSLLKRSGGKKYYERICVTCGKIFKTRKKNVTHCSPECAHKDEKVRAKLREAQRLRIENGTHNGWNSRNITSYSEKFWIKVLENNGIKYDKENHENGKYFLDFLIVKNGKMIDLEIDGKQHEYQDRKEHDMLRDEYLKNNGYIVYRVKWNEISTEDGKKLMESKIRDFLKFYTEL